MATDDPTVRSGPLRGVRVIEMAGMGPAPMAGTLLADLGADVIRVDRAVGEPNHIGAARNDILIRPGSTAAVPPLNLVGDFGGGGGGWPR